jgi:hypothetical protein
MCTHIWYVKKLKVKERVWSKDQRASWNIPQSFILLDLNDQNCSLFSISESILVWKWVKWHHRKLIIHSNWFAKYRSHKLSCFNDLLLLCIWYNTLHIVIYWSHLGSLPCVRAWVLRWELNLNLTSATLWLTKQLMGQGRGPWCLYTWIKILVLPPFSCVWHEARYLTFLNLYFHS